MRSLPEAERIRMEGLQPMLFLYRTDQIKKKLILLKNGMVSGDRAMHCQVQTIPMQIITEKG